MLKDYMETYVLLLEDGTTGRSFLAALTPLRMDTAAVGGVDAGVARMTMTHDRTLSLRPMDLVRRERDGAVFRALTDSAERTSPAGMRNGCRLAEVERVVSA